MNKNTLITYLDKFHLNGVINSVKLSIKDKVLTTLFVSEDKSMAGSVTANKFDFEDAELGVFETSKLKSFLKILDDEIKLTLNKADDVPVSLTLSDKNMEVNFMLSDLSVIPPAPKVKEIKTFEVEIPVTAEFSINFIKAKNALPDVDSFTFLMNRKKELELVIGYASINSNRIKLDVKPVSGKDALEKPISFNANYFKEILLKNADCTGAVLKIAQAGISNVEFTNTEFVSKYFLIQKQIDS
jgi:hypothetical protein